MRGNPDKIKGQGFHTNPERINKSGRPKKLPALDDLLSNIPEKTYQAVINKLAEKAKKGDVRAVEVLLDRGWGKAKQPVEIDSEITVTVKHES